MTEQTLKDIDKAFKALEERDELLDKIKAEINEQSKMHMDGDLYIKTSDCLRIIDKYRAESEDKG